MKARTGLQTSTFRSKPVAIGSLIALCSGGSMLWATSAWTQEAVGAVQPQAGAGAPASAQTPQPAPYAEAVASQAAPADAQVAAPSPTSSHADILSRDTLTVLVDGRLAVANGATSFVNGGFGKTRFQGGSNGDFKPTLIPAEVDVVWEPRFTDTLTANISAAYQHDHRQSFDLIEAFLDYQPRQTGAIGVSARAGLMWPEISLEHSTGGAWSVVNTITPSAINSWVGEEVKVVGVEATLHAALGLHQFSATGAVFGFNDTSGTLLSFRGWALQDIKATAFGDFRLPPLNPFIRLLQQNLTRSTAEIDNRAGYYGRLDWRPPWPFGVAVFYYDNEGNPQAFTPQGQWGWRTRFWNVGLNADIASNTKLLAQAMTGSTVMGFKTDGLRWVHTRFNSAYVLVTHSMGSIAVTGRAEAFDTKETGSEMPPDNSEHGWALTLAGRARLSKNLSVLAEVLNVHSWRGTRVELGGLGSPFESQTVFQLSFRYRL